MPENFAAREATLLGARPWLLSTALRMNLGNPERQLLRHAREVRVPVLVVHGTDDRLVPMGHARALFEALRARSPKSRFVALPGGHMVHSVRPDDVADAMADFAS